MSSPQALADLKGERLDSHQRFLELYSSIVDDYRKLVPLEETVLSFKKKVSEGKISNLEVNLLKKDMDEVLQMYDKLEKTSADIVALRKQIQEAEHPRERENEVNAIIKTKAYIFESLCKNPSAEKGLKLAEELIEEHHKEIQAEFDEIRRNISKRIIE